MDSSLVLGGLKWAAIALTLASALWGLLAQKPTREDAEGRKQLTPAGFVTIVMMVGGTMVSAVSFGFETMAQDAEREAAKDAKAAAARDKRYAAEAQIRRDEISQATRADARAVLAEARARTAEERAEQANARVIAVTLASEQRMRDLALSRQVAVGARENLGRTEQALGQLERVLLPLEALTVDMTLEFPADAPAMMAWAKRAAEGVRLREEAERKRERCSHCGLYRPDEIVFVDAKDEIYPGVGQDERYLRLTFEQLHLDVFVFAEGTTDANLQSIFKNERWKFDETGDLHFRLTPEHPLRIGFVTATRALRIAMSGTMQLAAMGRTGAVVSLPDLERGVAVIAVNDIYLLGKSQPADVMIATPSRRYAVSVSDMRRIPASGRRAVFILPRLRSKAGP